MVVELEWDPLRAVDVTNQTTAVHGEYRRADDGPALHGTMDRRVTLIVDELRFDDAYVVADRLDTGERVEFGHGTVSRALEAGSHRARLALPVTTFLRFDGPATVTSPDHDTVALSFAEPTAVTIGFRSRIKRPREEVTTTPTPEGVAALLTRFAAGHSTTTPDRSFPAMRTHPPTVRFEPEADLPIADPSAGDSPAGDLPEDAPTVTVPPAYGALLTVAPLAYYLGARVRVVEGASPTLTTRREHRLDEPCCVESSAVRDLPADAEPGFESRVAAVLRRTFYLDCIVRNAGPNGTELVENTALDELPLDAETLYDAPVAERVDAYLDADFDAVADVFPEWHLSVYLAPGLRSVRALPHVLYNVPQVYSPRARPLEGDEWLTRSLDDFYRGARESESVDLVNPVLGPSRTHGWLAPDTPIDVFKSRLAAYQNRSRHRAVDDEGISVVAVVNEEAMTTEGTEAATIYRRRAGELDLDVAVHEGVGVDALAEVFAGDHEFVHFIGHCEPEGLVCSDGHFDAAALDAAGVETFFLNACGSFRQGIELIETGSVAGGVTFNRVLDRNAARVGSAFARLLMRGYTFERALTVARRQIMSGKDYAVVGDGTHSVVQTNGLIASVYELEALGDDAYRLVQDAYSPAMHGGTYRSLFQTRDGLQLYGAKKTFELSEERLRTEFAKLDSTPIVFDGDLRWSDELDAWL
ncbi:hypothetical protein JCM17823_24410 [Halorubrum gandharaense]